MSAAIMALAVLLWGTLPAYLCARLFPRRRPAFLPLLLWNLAGLLLLLFLAGRLSPELHAEDSFWTLTPPARTGLAALSGLLILSGAWLAYRAAIWLSYWSRTTPGRLLAFLANLTLTPACTLTLTLLLPQIYYQYYRLLDPNLPQQWVLRGPAGLTEILAALSLKADSTLSALTSGGAFWLYLSLTITIHAAAWRGGHSTGRPFAARR